MESTEARFYKCRPTVGVGGVFRNLKRGCTGVTFQVYIINSVQILAQKIIKINTIFFQLQRGNGGGAGARPSCIRPWLGYYNSGYPADYNLRQCELVSPGVIQPQSYYYAIHHGQSAEINSVEDKFNSN